MAVNHNIHQLQASSLSSSASMTTIFFLLITTITPALAQRLSNYCGFTNSEVNLTGDASIDGAGPYSEVNLAGDAVIDGAQSYIQLTTVEQGNELNNVGRATNSKLMRLWDRSSRNLTYFTTEFSFKIFTENQSYADGMAFY